MFPDPERIRCTLERSSVAESGQRVFAWGVDGRTVSAAGVQQRGEEVEVLHLGTTPGEEGRGHARELVYALLDHLEAARLWSRRPMTAQ